MQYQNNDGIITLNLIEVIFKKQTAIVQRASYDQQLFDIEKESTKNLYFYNFDGFTYVWPINNEITEIPERYEEIEINLETHSLVFSKIFERSVIELFKKSGYDVYKLKYSSIWQFILQKDEQRAFRELTSLPIMNLSFVTLYSVSNERQIIGISSRFSVKPRFTTDENILTSVNIDTRDWDRNCKGEIVASKRNVSKYLHSTGQIDEYNRYYENIISDSHSFKKFKIIFNSFIKIKDRLFLPKDLEIEDFVLYNLPNSNFDITNTSLPTYHFYNEAVGKGRYDDRLRKLRPYSFDVFKNRTINILGLTPSMYQGSFETFGKSFSNRLKELFHIKDINFTIITFDNHPNGYIEKLDSTDLSEYDLAFIVFSEKDKELIIKDSPYYLTKAKLLNQRIASQDILIERIRTMNDAILNNVTLNAYTKMGGTAWTIEKEDKLKTELIIGIGSTFDENDNRIIGFTNVFEYNGTYLVGDCSQLCTSHDYSLILEKHLINLIQTVIKVKGIQPGDSFRLIFHLFKEASKKNEIAAIEKSLKTYSDYDIQFGITHLSYGHNYRVFKNEGNSKPDRGTFIQISSRQGIVCLGGTSSTPILIRLDKRSTYLDLYSTARQIIAFAHLSFRNFRPSSEPVTIKYPSLMAKFSSDLRQIPHWDPGILNSLGSSLWFI